MYIPSSPSPQLSPSQTANNVKKSVLPSTTSVEQITSRITESLRASSLSSFLANIMPKSWYVPKLQIEIRIATIVESEEITELAQSCFPVNAFNEEDIIHSIYRDQVYIAENGNHSIVGFSIIKDDYIKFLGVDYANRGKRVATFLLRHIFENSKQTLMRVHTRKSNQAAQALYRKLGFQLQEKIPNFYHNPKESPTEDAYLYCKKLKEDDL